MTFSIVIPTYNGADYIEKALHTALYQTRKADEIIISDDNSSDNTIEICKKYSDKIKIYINENGPSGFVNGWNYAIKRATSEYICILHQDDLLSYNLLEEAEKVLKLHKDIKHLFVPCYYIDSSDNIIYTPDYCDGTVKIYSAQEYIHAYQTIGSPHIHRCPGTITHRSIFKICQYRTEAGHIADDDFFYRVGQFTNIIGIMKPLAYYRIHNKSETGHLNNNDLIKRLTSDYIFQLEHFKENNAFTESAYEYFIDKAKHFSFDEFFMGIKYKDDVLENKGKNDIDLLKNKYKAKYNTLMNLFFFTRKILGVKLTSYICNI